MLSLIHHPNILPLHGVVISSPFSPSVALVSIKHLSLVFVVQSCFLLLHEVVAFDVFTHFDLLLGFMSYCHIMKV